jgi:hypothetical protein
VVKDSTLATMGDDDEAGQFKLTKDGRVYNKGKR